MDAKLDPNPTWVCDKLGATRAIDEIAKHAAVGYDSEFDGVRIGEESCVGKARVDVFSIAVPAGPITPVGFTPCKSWVFEGDLLTYGPVRAFLGASQVTKCVHNLTVDAHAAANQGVGIRGGLNTLSMARFVYPERANLARGNYDLDSLCQWRVGFGKVDDFTELFGYYDYEPYEEEVTKQRCWGCGEVGCRKKKGLHELKESVRVTVTRAKKVRRHHPLSGCRPGGPLGDKFSRYVKYAAADAELALILYQMLLIDGRKERAYPWTKLASIVGVT